MFREQVHSKNLWVAQPSPEGWEADSCFQLGICFHQHCRGAGIHLNVFYIHGIQLHDAPAAHGAAGIQVIWICSSLRLSYY